MRLRLNSLFQQNIEEQAQGNPLVAFAWEEEPVRQFGFDEEWVITDSDDGGEKPTLLFDGLHPVMHNLRRVVDPEHFTYTLNMFQLKKRHGLAPRVTLASFYIFRPEGEQSAAIERVNGWADTILKAGIEINKTPFWVTSNFNYRGCFPDIEGVIEKGLKYWGPMPISAFMDDITGCPRPQAPLRGEKTLYSPTPAFENPTLETYIETLKE